jgi:hypothetical protein
MRAVWHTARYWGPLVGALGCLIAGLFTGTIVAWVLFIAAFGLLLDGVTAMWERAGRSGNVTTHRQ